MSRIRVWCLLMRGVPEGQVLPLHLRVISAILFPRRSLLWFLQKDCGFDLMTACWNIHGVRFSDRLFVAMADPRPGVVYRFTRKRGSSLVTVEALLMPELEGDE